MLLRSERGYALILALAIVILLGLIAASVSALIIRGLASVRHEEQIAKAQAIAQGGLEWAILKRDALQDGDATEVELGDGKFSIEREGNLLRSTGMVPDKWGEFEDAVCVVTSELTVAFVPDSRFPAYPIEPGGGGGSGDDPGGEDGIDFEIYNLLGREVTLSSMSLEWVSPVAAFQSIEVRVYPIIEFSPIWTAGTGGAAESGQWVSFAPPVQLYTGAHAQLRVTGFQSALGDPEDMRQTVFLLRLRELREGNELDLAPSVIEVE